MSALVTDLQDLVAVSFLALGASAAAAWFRRRDRSSGYLALAILLLAVLVSSGRLVAWLHLPLLAPIELVLFMGSAYSLLLLRSTLVPLSWRIRALALGAVVVAMLVGIVVSTARPGGQVDALQIVAGIAVIGVWLGMVCEPVIRFWLISRRLPAILRWRLRSLSLGFAGVALLLVFSVVAGSLARSQPAQVATELFVLLLVPLLWVSFSPPSWVRRQWRAAEEEGLQRYVQVLASIAQPATGPDPEMFAWALRLAGAESAVAWDESGRVIGCWDLDGSVLADLDLMPDPSGEGRSTTDGSRRPILSVPFGGAHGIVSVGLVAGRFSPTWGADEAHRVRQYLAAASAALDRAQLVEELRDANGKLRDANEHKSVFLANMSHELRTPLNAIIGFSELLIDDSDGQFDASTRLGFLEQIHASGDHLLTMINDILDLSKIEAGQMDIRREPVDLAEIIGQSIQIVGPLAAKKRIQLSCRAEGGVSADPGKLKQMLLNLISNAIKFTGDGGAVTVETSRTDQWIEIAVADTGIGIAEGDRARIFDAFQQADSSSARQEQGTGLGLTLTRRFAILHGGDVVVESRVGVGSVFTIRLPAFDSVRATPAQPPNDLSAETGGGPRVLVVEDNPSAAQLLARQLRLGGFQVDIARSGPEALAKAQGIQPPIAITLDILLPELDGWSVLTQLKENPHTRSIPVIVVSVTDDRELGVALGAFDFLVKPVAAKDLLERLDRVLPGHARPGTRTVLVVDDESANRAWLRHVLEPGGFRVLEAEGGQQAIELAHREVPDVLLLDLLMPEVSGFKVVEALRNEPATAVIPILVITSKDLTEVERRQLSGHVEGILSRGTTAGVDLLSWMDLVAKERKAI